MAQYSALALDHATIAHLVFQVIKLSPTKVQYPKVCKSSSDLARVSESLIKYTLRLESLREILT